MRVAVIGRSTNTGSFVSHIAVAFRELGHEASTHQMRMVGEPRRGRLANVASIVRTDVVSRSPVRSVSSTARCSARSARRSPT